jgi:two-component system NarL family sensor kinase
MKTRPKSILCTPIAKQAQYDTIIYLENNLTVGAFTRDRLQVINLLASQAGISIENARLFDEKLKYAEELCDEISERNRVESALRESEARYRSVYETAPLVFVVWDAECRVMEWNEEAEKTFGYKKNRVLGKSFFDLIIPDIEREFTLRIVKDLLNGKIEKHIVNQNITKSGELIWCEWNNAVLHGADGSVNAAISLGLGT